MQRTFDRLPSIDERNALYPMRTLVAAKPLRSYTWRCNTWLDQGSEGACVGFAWAHDVAARPRERLIDGFDARNIYHAAQRVDEWPGEDYEGTSVLGGAKVCHELGHFAEYRWATSLDDLLLGIGYFGPAVLGVNWYQGMSNTDDDGYIHAVGSVLGGHAILAHSVNVKQQYVVLHNSWGQSWGVNGRAKILFEDLEALLNQDGEACIPVRRL
jgi:hypothetical protein